MISAMAKKILMDSPDVSQKTGDRVYLMNAPKTARKQTYIVLQALPANRGERTSSGQVRSTQGQIVANCIAPTQEESWALADAVQEAMLNAHGQTVLGKELQQIAIDNYEPQPIEHEGDDEPQAYGHHVFIDYLY